MRTDGIMAVAAAAVRAAGELDEAMARCRSIAAQWDVEADGMIRAAEELARTTTMSTAEALGYVTERTERGADRGGPHSHTG